MIHMIMGQSHASCDEPVEGNLCVCLMDSIMQSLILNLYPSVMILSD